MATSRLGKVVWRLALLLLAGCITATAAETGTTWTAATDSNGVALPTGVQVTLAAPYTTTSWDERNPDARFELPLLFLHRQGQATAEAERTLELRLVGLPGGSQVRLEVQSHHVDVSTGHHQTHLSPLILLNHTCTAGDPCTLPWTFDAATASSDFYYLRLKDHTGRVLWTSPHPECPDFAILDTWDVDLGAYHARVFLATLFPFARGETDLHNRLAPNAVTDFIAREFSTIIQDTWRTQVEEWGSGQPFHTEWDRDRVIQIIINAPPFAQFDGAGMHTAAFKVNGHLNPERQVWWRSSLDNFAAYATLQEAYRAAFAHEFFHLLQWNTRLSAGSPTSGWRNVFVEAQACAAVTIQYPELELGSRNTEFSRAATRFLAGRLNTSYRALEAHPVDRYDAALYWRFLYETYPDVGIFHAALEAMAGQNDADIVGSIKPVLDAAFSRYAGPFYTFEESLVAFARANYALHLENGRCTSPDLVGCGGRLYDAHGLYVDPPLEGMLDLNGDKLIYDGAIPSYGMDFIEVRLDPALRNQPLYIVFERAGTAARFNVQLWKLAPGAWKPRAFTEQPEVMAQAADGTQTYTLPSLDTTAYDRLALIITRLDSEETVDPAGQYRITLESTDGT